MRMGGGRGGGDGSDVRMTLNGKCEKGPIKSASHPWGGGGGSGKERG